MPSPTASAELVAEREAIPQVERVMDVSLVDELARRNGSDLVALLVAESP